MTATAKKRKKPVKRKGATLTRFVYVLERVTKKTAESRLKGLREIKIGISFDAHDRADRVDDGIPGRVVILEDFKCRSASKVENRLHTKYGDVNFTVKNAKRGSGASEFFRLTTRQVDSVMRYLEAVEVQGLKAIKSDEWLEDEVGRPPIVLVSFLSAALFYYLKLKSEM